MESPCIKLCTLDAAGAVCLGCGRSLAEIAAWASADATTQAAILRAAAARRAAQAASIATGASSTARQ